MELPAGGERALRAALVAPEIEDEDDVSDAGADAVAAGSDEEDDEEEEEEGEEEPEDDDEVAATESFSGGGEEEQDVEGFEQGAEEDDDDDEEEEEHEGEEEGELPTEAEGFKLHLSSASATGYKGVCLNKGRYEARDRVGGKSTHIGSYGTAVEAAVALAKHRASAASRE